MSHARFFPNLTNNQTLIDVFKMDGIRDFSVTTAATIFGIVAGAVKGASQGEDVGCFAQCGGFWGATIGLGLNLALHIYDNHVITQTNKRPLPGGNARDFVIGVAALAIGTLGGVLKADKDDHMSKYCGGFIGECAGLALMLGLLVVNHHLKTNKRGPYRVVPDGNHSAFTANDSSELYQAQAIL